MRETTDCHFVPTRDRRGKGLNRAPSARCRRAGRSASETSGGRMSPGSINSSSLACQLSAVSGQRSAAQDVLPGTQGPVLGHETTRP
ncbi:hypothetical protein ACFPRL_16325 [Pseudoclavibacter helvolus]